MEDKLSFVLMPSLKEMAMRRLAIVLWTQPDMLAKIKKFSSKIYSDSFNDGFNFEKWFETVENKVIDKLSKLEIPLSKQMLLTVRLIGLQIPRWRMFHAHYLQIGFGRFKRPVLEKLCWTTAGTIDYLQTAKEILRCELFDPKKCYLLACLYCLEDSIPLLWEELSKKVQREYYKTPLISDFRNEDLPSYWSFIVRGKQDKLEGMIRRTRLSHRSFNQVGLLDSAGEGNRFAAEYYFQKLSVQERSLSFLTQQDLHLLSHKFLTMKMPQEHAGDVMSYLLSKIDYELQMKMIRNTPIEVLTCFLHWPYQDIFLKISDLVWSFLTTEQYEDLLEIMTTCFTYSNYSFPKFFQEWFTRSPMEFRKRFVEYESRLGEFFPIIFHIQDSETIDVVLRNLDPEDRVKLLSSEHTLKLYQSCILKEEWQMVEACVRDARLPRVDIEKVMKEFLRFLTRTGRERNKQVWTKFLQVLEGTAETSHSKRHSEDETQNQEKKLCPSDTSECSTRRTPTEPIEIITLD